MEPFRLSARRGGSTTVLYATRVRDVGAPSTRAWQCGKGYTAAIMDVDLHDAEPVENIKEDTNSQVRAPTCV